jgi:hypothetical protein
MERKCVRYILAFSGLKVKIFKYLVQFGWYRSNILANLRYYLGLYKIFSVDIIKIYCCTKCLNIVTKYLTERNDIIVILILSVINEQQKQQRKQKGKELP